MKVPSRTLSPVGRRGSARGALAHSGPGAIEPWSSGYVGVRRACCQVVGVRRGIVGDVCCRGCRAVVGAIVGVVGGADEN